MKEIIAYEMKYDIGAGGLPEYTLPTDMEIKPFATEYADEYIEKYNEAFHAMREALEIEPYDFYSDASQLRQNGENTFLLLRDGILCGGVSCYGAELDDLFVAKRYCGKGFGRLLLRYGMKRIYENGGANAITLHAAEWNDNAVRLYMTEGFSVFRIERYHI